MASSSARVELPANLEDVPIEHLVQLIADMLQRLMAHNDQIPLSPESLTRFHSRAAPGISVLEYLQRIVRFTNVEKSCLLLTLVYIDQICALRPRFTLSSLTCHRFIITSITVSSKGLCDTFCPNKFYARVGGISVTELNMLEREFLHMIDWRLMVSALSPLHPQPLSILYRCPPHRKVFLHSHASQSTPSSSSSLLSALVKSSTNITSTSSAPIAGVSIPSQA